MSTMKRITDTLEGSETALTMGELMARGDIDKRFAGEVSSCLAKLVKRGDVVRVSVQSRSHLGRREVNGYLWVAKEVATQLPPPPTVVEDDPRRMLGAPLFIGRIA